jgi:leucyl/phenylalanyl-tRNA--protein transferase
VDRIGNAYWIEASDPPDSFPDPDQALDDTGGLLAIGGDLSTPRLLAAYSKGIYPWYDNEWQPILWWSPDPRAVLFPPELHVSRSLRKTIRKNVFTVSVDRDFPGVVERCASTRMDAGTWINPSLAAAYCKLHEAGHAHAIEIWADNELVGGLYGVNLGRIFFGESMFSLKTDASKVALVYLVDICRKFSIELIDCQLASAHLSSLGSRQISRKTFQELLRRYTGFPRRSGWARDQRDTAGLLP